jgi:hypothetical protein
MAQVVVIGAGMAGAACARGLADAGRAVTVIDKGRSVGGRLAQRRTPAGTFDHGAQYMKAREPGLAALMERLAAAGLVAPWPAAAEGGVVPWIGTPAMSAPVKALLAGIEVIGGRRVTALARAAGGWAATDDTGAVTGPFAAAVIAVPAPQAVALLAPLGLPAVAGSVAGAVMAPCWAGLVAFAAPLPVDGEVVRPGGDLAWAARHRTKPGRGEAETWTAHADPAWSRRHLELPPEEVAPALLRLLEAALSALPAPVHLEAHRWRHALVERPLGVDHLLAAGGTLGLCGDWCLGPRVEAAWRSGTTLAEALLAAGGLAGAGRPR